MIGNRIKQTTSTTGTGTIDLIAAPSGFINFMDHFDSGDLVTYLIESGNNWEIGVGTITDAATDTLSRTYIYETLVSGTYTKTEDGSGTAITLSGTSTVMCTATTRSIGFDQAVFGSQVLATTFNEDVLSGCPIAGNGSGFTAVADYLYLFPLLNHVPRKIADLGVYVKTVDAGDPDTRVAIYNLNRDGTAHETICETGDLDVSATGVTLDTLSQEVILPPGMYLMAILSASSTLVVRATTRATTEPCFGMSTFGTLGCCFRKTQTAGSFPSDPTGFSIINSVEHVLLYLE